MRLVRPLCQLGVAAALLTGMFVAAPRAVVGQPPKGRDKGTTENGQVQAGADRVRLVAGKMYWVRVVGNGFSPRVAVHPGGLSPLQMTGSQPVGFGRPGMPAQFVGPGQLVGPGGGPGGAAQGNVFEGLVDPKETREYKILVTANPDGEFGDQPLGYALTVSPLTAILDKEDQTAPTDPRYQNGAVNQGPHKEYPVQFKAGQMCIITLDATQPGAGGFDPYLVLEGPGGDVVAQNDDGGQGNNSRIVHRSKRGGEYRVIATGLGGGAGAYRVRVVAAPADDGGKAAPAPDAPGNLK